MLSLSALLIAASAFAQVTTASIAGKVVDASGEALPGVAVVAVHAPSGTQYYSVTNADGRYAIHGMRPGGPYEVSTSLLGFEPVKISGLSLNLGETANVSPVLKESSELLSEVVVTAEGGVDATKTGAAQSFNSRQIAEMPSITRGIADVARMNPFIRTDNSGAMTFAGANNRYNSFQIDGAMNNDVFGLTSNGSNGGQAGTQPVSMETIEQVQVNIAPFDVRQSGFTGGSINAITKSGTNKFHGSVYGFGNNQALYGPKRYAEGGSIYEKAMSQQLQYQAGLTVGGPIIKDKLFFFASYEKSSNTYPNNYGLGSEASKVDAKVAQEVYDWVVAEAKKQGTQYTGALPTDSDVYTKSDKATAKIDWNINDANKLAVRWSLVSAKQLNSVSTATYLDATDYSYDFVSNTNSFVAELQSRISDNVSNELRGSYVRVRDQRKPLGDAFPMIQVGGVGGGTLCLGNERSSEANRLDQDIFTLTDNLTIYAGSHTVTVGTHNEFYKFTNLFIQDKYGTYYFDSPADLYAGNIKQYRIGHANVAVTGNENWEPTFKAAQVGFYAQDKWDIADNFDLTYGVRVDVPIFIDKPTENVPFTGSDVAKKWDVATNRTASSAPLVSPRLGFRWDLANNGKAILRGGAGVFTGRIPFVWFSNNFSNTGVQLTSINSQSFAPQKAGCTLILDPTKQGANESKLTAGGSQTINVVDPKFHLAQNLRLDLGFDFKLLGIDWTLEGVYSKTLNDVAYKQLAYETNGKTLGATYPALSFDNRPMFSKVTNGTPFANIYMLTNTPTSLDVMGEPYSLNLMAQAKKSFPFGLDLNASYTYTRSKSRFNGTSSVAQSNFAYNYTHGDSNNPELSYSAFNIPHQIKASVSYHVDYAKHWTTTVGAVYIGTSGAAYSVYYNGDLNGDSSNGNDLMFIPTDSQIDAMLAAGAFKAGSGNNAKYTPEVQAANMKKWLGSAQYMKDHRGQYFDRYADNLPFEHHIDVHFGQKFSFNVGKQVHSVELTFDIINFANMLNPKWGRSYGMGINSYYNPVSYSGNGQFQFLQSDTYSMFTVSDILSRWRGQVGLKYAF